MSKPPNYVLGSLFAIALLIGFQYPQIFGLEHPVESLKKSANRGGALALIQS